MLKCGYHSDVNFNFIQGIHLNHIFKFPVFSRFIPCLTSNLPLYQFMSFVTISSTKLTKQTYPASKRNWKFLRQILKYILPLELGNLQLDQTKFPVFSLSFGKISTVPVFQFSLFSLCSGYPVYIT